METLYGGYVVFGLTVLLLAMSAGFIKQVLWLSEPLLAMLVGILVGPVGLHLFDPARLPDQQLVLEELARVTLAISLIGVAFRLPDRWIRRCWRPLLVLLLAGMPLMWLISGLCGWFMLHLPLLQALLLGAIISPTDPVVASSIVTGELADRSVEVDTRHLISAESGANDGLAFLLVMLPSLLLEKPAGEAIVHWLSVVLFGEVLFSILAGAAFGILVGLSMRKLYRWEHTHNRSLLAVSLAMAITLLGLAKLLHGDAILAVFAAGLALNWLIGSGAGFEEARHERIQETMKRFLDVPIFVFFGMIMPVKDWLAEGWPLAFFGIAILVLRRMPVLLLLRPFLAPVRGLPDALFVGWFGPIAVAAMVYSTWADVHEGYQRLWVLGSYVIFLSILIHGITATPFTRWYARHAGKVRHGRQEGNE